VPGSPLDTRAHGCNQLIRDGAVLVQSADDVVELLSGFNGPQPARLRSPTASWPDAGSLEDEPPAELADLLTTAPVAVDELIRQSGESASAVHLALLELELAGRLVRHAAGRVSRAA
jgi:DNA processing protein